MEFLCGREGGAVRTLTKVTKAARTSTNSETGDRARFLRQHPALYLYMALFTGVYLIVVRSSPGRPWASRGDSSKNGDDSGQGSRSREDYPGPGGLPEPRVLLLLRRRSGSCTPVGPEVCGYGGVPRAGALPGPGTTLYILSWCTPSYTSRLPCPGVHPPTPAGYLP